jgi:hypothetical protein
MSNERNGIAVDDSVLGVPELRPIETYSVVAETNLIRRSMRPLIFNLFQLGSRGL